MLIIIELIPLRLSTLPLMVKSGLLAHASFETLIQLYFDCHHHSFDIRDLMIEEVASNGEGENKLNEIWEAMNEFHILTNNYMGYFLGNYLTMARYKEICGNTLCLEYWKSDEIKLPTTSHQDYLRHRSFTQGIPELPRNQLALYR